MRWIFRKHNAAFTLVEILIAVAIISLLAAIAVPQYLKFISRARRAEAYLILNATHKSQTAYFASTDHYLKPAECDPGINCYPDPVTSHLNADLGLEDRAVTHNGYQYHWTFNAGGLNYQLILTANLDDDEGGTISDQLLIGVNNWPVISYCPPCGFQEGVPYLFADDIANKINCYIGC